MIRIFRCMVALTLMPTVCRAYSYVSELHEDTAISKPATHHDLSCAALPWIATGLVIRSEREHIRNVRNKFQYKFHNTADNYSQYAPLLLTTGLKALGVEGRSSWGRYAVSSAASYAVMATLVNTLKYSAKELRPDGSSRNSFPSGHTATAFAAATILHKEYGMTRSPWYSIAGYMMATATGCMRVLNNRHWVSDTFAGAGIGILSAELGYTVGDMIFKNRGLLRHDLKNETDLYKYPSFFNVRMGLGVGEQQFDLTCGNWDLKDYYDGLPVRNLKFSKATEVGAEGAFFLTRHIGIGGRLRVVSRRVKNWSDFARSPIGDLTLFDPQLEGFLDSYTLHVESDHLSEFDCSGGLYLNLPLGRRFSLGTKLLIGRSYLQGIDINAEAHGHQRDIDASVEVENGRRFLVYEILGDPQSNGKPYSSHWDYLSFSGDRTMSAGTGLSLTFSYRSLMAWKFFIDYDLTRHTYTTRYSPTLFLKDAARSLTFEGKPVSQIDTYFVTDINRQKKTVANVIIGGAFSFVF